jgi:hypothetical protein
MFIITKFLNLIMFSFNTKKNVKKLMETNKARITTAISELSIELLTYVK